MSGALHLRRDGAHVAVAEMRWTAFFDRPQTNKAVFGVIYRCR